MHPGQTGNTNTPPQAPDCNAQANAPKYRTPAKEKTKESPCEAENEAGKPKGNPPAIAPPNIERGSAEKGKATAITNKSRTPEQQPTSKPTNNRTSRKKQHNGLKPAKQLRSKNKKRISNKNPEQETNNNKQSTPHGRGPKSHHEYQDHHT